MLFKALLLAVGAGTALAQNATVSVCDKYTTALLMNNTAANQLTLLTLIVNTAVIGNYTKPNVGISVAGILAPGEYNGTAVDLLPYFNGGLASTNEGGSATSGKSVNFLDSGGAAPLKENKPAEDMNSLQYTLLTHLYEYFGALLGCSMMGTTDFPAYDGAESMYEVHKFMDLSAAEVGYFITQVALSGASFGVEASELQVVGTALGTLFGHKCSPPTIVLPGQTAQLQAICIGDDCPISENATCSSYAAVTEPSTAVSSLVPTSTASVTGSPTGTSAAASATSAAASGTSAPSSVPSGNAAAVVGINVAVVLGGVAAMFL